MTSIRSKPWIIETSKNSEFRVIWWDTEEIFILQCEIKCRSGHAIDEVDIRV